MKKLLLFLFVSVFPLIAQQMVPVTGTIQTYSGQAGTSYIEVSLVNCGSMQPTVNGVAVMQNGPVDFYPGPNNTFQNSDGSPAQLYGNDVIACGYIGNTSRYTIQQYVNGSPAGTPKTYYVQSGISFNLNTANPVHQLPPLKYPNPTICPPGQVNGGMNNDLSVACVNLPGAASNAVVANPSGTQNVVQPVGTKFNFTGDMNLLGNSYGSQTSPTEIATWNAVKSRAPYIWEDYLSASDGQGGTDYGYALQNFVNTVCFGNCNTLTAPVEVVATAPGARKVFTDAPTFTGPVKISGPGGWFVPQSTLAKTYTTATGATLTYQNPTGPGPWIVTVPTANVSGSFVVGEPIGGIGIPHTAILLGVTPIGANTSLTLSLPPSLIFTGQLSSSGTVCGVSSLVGLQVNQTVSGPGISTGTTISAINAAYTAGCGQSVTLSPAPTPISNLPTTITVTSSWSSWLQAIQAAPLFSWQYDPSGLHNLGGQMYGAGIDDIWINDTGDRAVPGVQGVQVNGFDSFMIHGLRVDSLDGAGLIFGGQTGPSGTTHQIVRESDIQNLLAYNTGDWSTGQSEWEVVTGTEGYVQGADEINQISCISCHLIFPDGEAITSSSYNYAHVGDGPREVWLMGDTQIEGGSYSPSQNICSQSDLVHLVNSRDWYIDHAELNCPGSERALVRIDNGDGNPPLISMDHDTIRNRGNQVYYTVSLQAGSTAVGFLGGGVGRFDSSRKWDGIPVKLIDGSTCTIAVPCIGYLSSAGGVSANGLQANLSAPFTGTTNLVNAQMVVGLGGYALEGTNTTISSASMTSDLYYDLDTQELFAMGLANDTQSLVIGGASITNINQERLHWTNASFPSGTSMFGNAATPLQANSNSASNAVIAKFYAPALSTSQTACMFSAGVTGANYNAVQMCLDYIGNGSNTNTGHFGLVGGTQIYFYADGHIAPYYTQSYTVRGTGTTTAAYGATAQVGTSPTPSGNPACVTSCQSMNFSFSFSTGTGTLSSGVILTLQLPSGRSSPPTCVGNIDGGSQALQISFIATSSTAVNVKVSTALSPTTTYTVSGMCVGGI